MPFAKGHSAFAGTEKTRFKKGQVAWNRQNCVASCSLCKKTYNTTESLIKTRKFCSKKCYTKYQQQNPNDGTYKNGHLGLREEKNGNWKGKHITYLHLHEWINAKRGKANKCEFCGKNEGRFEWANKSHEYKRTFNDWISLCGKCHSKYDNRGEKISKSLKKYHANNS